MKQENTTSKVEGRLSAEEILGNYKWEIKKGKMMN